MTADIIEFRSLGRDVLIVAVAYVGDRGDGWKALVGAVPGKSHASEAERVADYGTVLPERLARAAFERLASLTYYER